MKKEYYLGLDIGTNSVGWCVTDENYRIVRGKGKDLWGVRLFSEAKTAADRRSFRSSRRRTQRKKLRLQLLRELFEDEINKVDNDFFLRLDESKYYPEDKKVLGKNSLFNDENYTDKDYFKKYPTIFHLRKDLMVSTDKRDIRLYFLAINQMMKRRGHFLIDGKISNITDVSPFKSNLQGLLNDEFDLDLGLEFYDRIFEVFLNNNLGKNDKKNHIKNIVKEYEQIKPCSKYMTNILNLIVSGKATIKSVFSDENIIEKLQEKDIKNIEIVGDKYEEDKESLEEVLGYKFEIISNLKAIYDFIILQDILGGEKYLSYAKVKSYDKHGKDLKKLKKLIRKYDKDGKIYNELFRDKNNKKGYVAYLGYYKNKSAKEIVKKITNDEFYLYLKKCLNKICDKDDQDYLEILKDIENDNFLELQISSKNFAIPYQIHLLELQKILENLVRDYPSFKEISDGVTKVEKIELIFKFKIPYYVGPLNNYHRESSNAWIVKNKGFEKEKIRPWNFAKAVDMHACEEEFIKRMINECTYLPNEKVLPKSSLLYSEYLVLNELNNLKVNGEKLNKEIKEGLINDLFKKYKKVSLKRIKDYLKINYCEDEKIEITGLADDIKSSLFSYIDFVEIFGNNFDKEMVDDLIEQITIHTGNKKLLRKKIKDKYKFITDKQLNKIINKKYKDWARFSKKLLVGIEGTNKETGEVNTILGFLRESNDNFMELLSSRYTFSDVILEEKSKYLPNKLDYQVIKDMYISPSVKKMIWQVVEINEEIIKVLGKTPSKIFIEMARGHDPAPKKTTSRKNQLLDLYKSIGKEGKIWQEKIKNIDEREFRNRALYLYYLQMGKCMYSGDPIDLDSISNKDMYDLDHIIPRKLKKDDSLLNNLVLVKRHINQHIKKDIYPVPNDIRANKKVREMWYYLYQKGFMGKEKYQRLIRRDPLTDRELAEFINRQLVETRQSTKVIKDLFENYYKDTKIITVKAGLVSELRHDLNFLKSRDINDLHHAHDAFLNIIVGDVWNKKFTSNPFNFIRKNKNSYTLNNIFTKDQKNISGEKIWSVKEGRKLIEKTLNNPSVIFSSESFEKSGKLFDVELVGKKTYKKNTAYLPAKKDKRLEDISKYGGYKSIGQSYFFIVEHTQKGKRIISIEGVPIYLKNKISKDENILITYCTENLGLIEPIIIRKELKIKSLLEINGFLYLLSGKTSNRLQLEPYIQMFWDVEKTNLWNKLYNTYAKSEKIENDLFSNEDRLNIIELVDIVKKRLKQKPYKNRINVPEVDKIIADKFTTFELFTILSNMIVITRKTNKLSDLRLLGKAKESGVTRISKNISALSSFTVIDQSITGIYEKRERII